MPTVRFGIAGDRGAQSTKYRWNQSRQARLKFAPDRIADTTISRSSYPINGVAAPI
jgi:hypothetical protein